MGASPNSEHPNKMPSEKFTLILDSSQLSLFCTCPQQWANRYFYRLVPSAFRESDAVPLNSGTYGHKLIEIFYRMKMRGYSLNDTIEAAWAYDPDKDTCECGCTVDKHKTLMPGLEECSRCRKCMKFRPHPFPLNPDDRLKVKNRFREYAYKYSNGADDFKPLSESSIEVGFSEPIYEDAENLFILEGRMDLLGTWQGLNCVVDNKFQMQTHWLYPNSIQFKNYTYVAARFFNTGAIPLLVVNYIRLQKNIQPDSLYRDLITFTVPQLLAWKEQLIGIYKKVKNVVQALGTGASHSYVEVEKNWDSCSGYGKTFSKNEPKYCWYGPLCEEFDKTVKSNKINQLYRIEQKVWQPW